MRIAYCTNVRLPSERAHGHQVAQVCDALVHLGHQVEIFCPYRKNVISQDYWTYYRARKEVAVQYIGSFDPIASPFLPGVLGLFWMNAQLRSGLATALKPGSFDLLYTRSPALLPALISSGIPTIVELHQLPKRNRHQFVRQCNQCVQVACLTSAMKSTLEGWGIESARLTIAGDAVDLSRFENLPTKEEARRMFGIDTNRLVVGYVGRLKTLGMDKGVQIMLQAFAQQKESKQFFGLIVGGPSQDQQEYEAMARELGLSTEDVLFTGEVSASQVPASLIACDVLAMPFPDFPHYRYNMSPLKMFEYMAADRPIVTTDLPTIRDVLDESSAFFCKPGDPADFARAITEIRHHPQEAHKRAEAARKTVEQHTWEKRMQRILEKVA